MMKRTYYGQALVFGLIAIAALFLSACGYYDSASQVVASEGQKAADRQLEASEWAICRAGSVGSVVRRYGQSEEKWKAWNGICHGQRVIERPTVPEN